MLQAKPCSVAGKALRLFAPSAPRCLPAWCCMPSTGRRALPLTFGEEPVPTKKFSVRPQRALAKEYFFPPFPAANASWSKRIYRGATIRPLALDGLGAGQCNGFAPQEWRVAAHAPDNSLFHVMADKGFAHALYKSGSL